MLLGMSSGHKALENQLWRSPVLKWIVSKTRNSGWILSSHLSQVYADLFWVIIQKHLGKSTLKQADFTEVAAMYTVKSKGYNSYNEQFPEYLIPGDEQNTKKSANDTTEGGTNTRRGDETKNVPMIN